MNPKTVKSALIGVIKDIQQVRGRDSPQITGSVCPVKDLPGFDSYICMAAMEMLSNSLGFNIPLDRNIFATADKKRLLTIDDASAVVFEAWSQGEH